jgi:hypothetical protein
MVSSLLHQHNVSQQWHHADAAKNPRLDLFFSNFTTKCLLISALLGSLECCVYDLTCTDVTSSGSDFLEQRPPRNQPI